MIIEGILQRMITCRCEVEGKIRHHLMTPGTHLFTYGTLMDDAVWSRVAQEKCVSRRALLHGYEARMLRGVTFPGLVDCAGAVTPGLVYFDVSAAAMARLDAYEDDFYERVPVSVILEDGRELTADVYLMMPAHRDVVLPGRWEPPVAP